MDRWWSDEQSATQMLDLVGGDDVMQGVGTAALGYHALLAGALRPLAKSTLIGVEDVEQAIIDVDLDPVAKSLAVAVYPIMKDASLHYGMMLAEEMRDVATHGAKATVLALTSQGLSWPQAVTRTAEMAGVSGSQAQVFVSKAKGPAMPPEVLADAADRALMAWAADMGLREARPGLDLEEVDKASRERQRGEHEHTFSEAQVNRDSDGQFATKDAEEGLSNRLHRLERRTRRAKRERSLAEMKPEPLVVERKQVKAEGHSLADSKRAQASGERAQVAGRGRSVVQGRTQQAAAAVTQTAAASRSNSQQMSGSLAQVLSGHEFNIDDFPDRTITGADLDVLLHDPIVIRAGHLDASTLVDEAQADGSRRVFDPTVFVVHKPYVTHEPHGKEAVEFDPDTVYKITSKFENGVTQHQLSPIYTIQKDEDWDPADHPRGEGGRFGSGRERRRDVDEASAAEQAYRERRARRRDRRQARESRLVTTRAPQQAVERKQVKAGNRQMRKVQLNVRPQKAQAKAQFKANTEANVTSATFNRERTALLLDTDNVGRLLGVYPGDHALAAGVMLEPTMSAINPALFVSSDTLNEHINKVETARLSQDENGKYVGMAIETPELLGKGEAMEHAREFAATHGVGGDYTLIPKIVKVEDGGMIHYEPQVILQDRPDSNAGKDHIAIVGDAAAMKRLAAGDVEGLRIQRTVENASGRHIAALGGGEDRSDIDFGERTHVLEIVDTHASRR